VQNEELNQPDYNEPLARDLAALPPEKAPPSPDNPPWNVFVALGVWIMSMAFIVIFPSIFLTPYLASRNVLNSDRQALTEFLMTDPTAVLLQLASVVPAHVLTILLAWLVVTNLKKYPFRQTLGWDWGGFKFWHAVAITFFFYALTIALNLVFGDVENDFEKMLKSSRTAVYLVAFFATFTAPLVEEVIYRGILFSALENPKKILFEDVGVLRRMQEFYRRHSTVFAVLIVTFLFAVIHIPQYSQNAVPDYATVFALLLLSLTLTVIRAKTRNLLPCFVLHTFFNGFQAALMIAFPYLEQMPQNPETKPEIAPVVFINFFM